MTAGGKVRLVCAAAADALVVLDGGRFLSRTPYGPDTPLRPGDCTPGEMRAALMTKWGYDPVVGPGGEPEPEIGAGEAALLERTKLPGGVDAWRVTELVPHGPFGAAPPAAGRAT